MFFFKSDNVQWQSCDKIYEYVVLRVIAKSSRVLAIV